MSDATIRSIVPVEQNELPELKVQRAMLEQTIVKTKQEAFGLFINAEYVGAQGFDLDSRKEAKAQAAEIHTKRKNILKGITRLKKLLAELPEPEPEDEGDSD